jgi:hypothetical protein
VAKLSQDLGLIGRVGFILGWICFGIAFLAAAMESSLGSGFITSANDLLLAYVPGKWIAFKLRHASLLFDIIVMPVMQLPGWLIAGIPASFLLFTFRPHREELDSDLLESLTTYDRLARQAADEGAVDDAPTYESYDRSFYDAEDLIDDPQTAKSYMQDWQPGEEDNKPFERPLGPEEKMAKAREHLSIPFDKLK